MKMSKFEALKELLYQANSDRISATRLKRLRRATMALELTAGRVC